MVYDLRNLQTKYMPVLGPNIPFLVLYANEFKSEGASRRKINKLLFKPPREANVGVAPSRLFFFFFANFFVHSPKRYLNEHI